jgi:hypothetical protein
MASQSLTLSPLATASERRRRSFWQRLLDAIVMSRQIRAAQEMAEYLRIHEGEHGDDFSPERERSFRAQQQGCERC